MAINRSLIYLFLIFLPFIGTAQKQDLNIRIVQDDTVIVPDAIERTVSLERGTFKIQVLLQNIKGVYVFASYSDSIYRLRADAPVPGFSSLPDRVMAESEFNKDKELLLSNEGWSYWFFDPGMNWHRFNKKIILLDSGRIIASKTIKQLYEVDRKKSIKLKEVTEPLYLFFVAPGEIDGTGKPLKELFRRKLKIEWQYEDQ